MLPIYYINLESRLDRQAFMQRQFQRLGLTAERIEAVTPAQLSPVDVWKYCDREARFFLRETELACTLSHEKAWQSMLDSRYSAALFLEDDAVLSDALPRFLDSYDACAHDLVRLEAVRRARILPATSIVAGDFHLHPFRSTFMGACGYILSDRGARLLLNSPVLRQRHLDFAIFNTFETPGRELDKRLVYPALCIQAGDQNRGAEGVGLSDIDTPAAKEERTRFSFLTFSAYLFSRLRNVFDHLVHLPLGLKTKSIPFLNS